MADARLSARVARATGRLAEQLPPVGTLTAWLVTAAALASPALAARSAELGAVRSWQLLGAPLLLALLLAQRRQPPRPPSPWTVPALFAALLLWMATGSALRFAGVHVNGVDFSIFDWMLENTLRGHLLYSPIYQVNHFGIHQTWPLLLLVPAHALFRSPWLLVAVGVLCLWSAAWVLWSLARRLVDADTALLAVVAYATGPWVGGLLKEGFRPESFFPLAVFTFALAWTARSRAWAVALAGAGLCLVKEDGGFYLAGFALAALLAGKRRALAFSLLAMASAVVWLDVGPVRHAALAGSGLEQPFYMQQWQAYGSTLPSVVHGMLRAPGRVLADLLGSGWFRVYGPALLLPLLSPLWTAAALPGLLLLATAADPSRRGFQGYHPVPVACFALVALLAVASRWRGRAELLLLARMALLSLPLWNDGYLKYDWPDASVRAGLASVRALVAGHLGPVCAQTSLYPQLGYPADLRPYSETCARTPGALSVLNPTQHRWGLGPEVDTDVAAATAKGTARNFAGGFVVLETALGPAPPLAVPRPSP